MLVVITIIGILSAMAFGALQMARETAREMATKATIAKLNNVIMRRYESYRTRRVPIRIPPVATLRQSAEIRLTALREIMRMEMPERWTDIINPSSDGTTPDVNVVPVSDFSDTVSVNLPRPALSRLYAQRYINEKMNDPENSPDYAPAECLYLLVSMGIPEAMEQFHQSEIGDVDGDGMPEFIDGWGKPIQWLRCAPGFSSDNTRDYSDIQFDDPINNHDPFDTRRIHSAAFHLIPLIYSAGGDGKYDIELDFDYSFEGDPYGNLAIGQPVDEDGDGLNHHDNITNHHIEQR